MSNDIINRLTPQIKGEAPFRCPVCDKLLLIKITGTCEVQLKCPRCKTFIKVFLKEIPLPDKLLKAYGVNKDEYTPYKKEAKIIGA